MPGIVLRALGGFSLYLYTSTKQVHRDEESWCTERLSNCPEHTQQGSGLARLNPGILAPESMFE